MSETTTPATPVASTEAVKPVEAAKPAAAAQAAASPEDPPYLSGRLERERVATLKKLGVKAPKGVSAEQAIADEKNKREKRKERTRVAESERDTYKAKAEAADSQLAVLKTYADIELGALDDAQRNLVKQIAGEDPAEQLRQIATMRSMRASMAPAPAAKAEEAAAPPIQPAASTAPGGRAPPPPADASSSTPIAQQYKDIRAMSTSTPKDAARRAVAIAMFAIENEDALLSAYTLA